MPKPKAKKTKPKGRPGPGTAAERRIVELSRKVGKLTNRDTSVLKKYNKTVVTAVYLFRGGPPQPTKTIGSMLLYLRTNAPQSRRSAM